MEKLTNVTIPPYLQICMTATTVRIAATWIRAFGWMLLFLGPIATSVLCRGLHAQEPRYDLVLRGGKVVDGTGNPWFYADVAD